MTNSSVDIIMATYNGERYIEEQINSIISQTYTNWNLIIQDDGSTDSTIEILKRLSANDDRIKFFVNEKNLGVSKNFWDMMNKCSAKYIMFCDQDDYWNSDKIETMLDFIEDRGISGKFMLYSDLELVDKKLNKIKESIYHHLNRDPYKNRLNRMLVRSLAVGCTTMIGRDLIPDYTPNSMVMHDYYLSLLAAINGNLHYFPSVTIKYRQHEGNVVGTDVIGKRKDLLIKRILNNLKSNNRYNDRYRQVEDILNNYSVSTSVKKMLNGFLKLEKGCILVKLLIVIRYKFYHDNIKESLLFLLHS